MSGAGKMFEGARLIAVAAVWVLPPEEPAPSGAAEPTPSPGPEPTARARGASAAAATARPEGEPVEERAPQAGGPVGAAAATEPDGSDDEELDSWLRETLGSDPRLVRQLLSELWSLAHFNPDGLRRILMAVTDGDELTTEAFLRWLVNQSDNGESGTSGHTSEDHAAPVIEISPERVRSILLSPDEKTRPYPRRPPTMNEEGEGGDVPGEAPEGSHDTEREDLPDDGRDGSPERGPDHDPNGSPQE